MRTPRTTFEGSTEPFGTTTDGLCVPPTGAGAGTGAGGCGAFASTRLPASATRPGPSIVLRLSVIDRPPEHDATAKRRDLGHRVGVAAQRFEIARSAVREVLAREDQLERIGIHRVVVEQRLVDALLAQRHQHVVDVARLGVRGECGAAAGAGTRAQLT